MSETNAEAAAPVAAITDDPTAPLEETEQEAGSGEAATGTEQPEEEFAIVEVFGHRRLFGRICEVERFGAKFLRIDIPAEGDFEKGYTSQLYGGASIFSVTATDRATVERNNRPYHAARPLLSYDEDEEEDDSWAHPHFVPEGPLPDPGEQDLAEPEQEARSPAGATGTEQEEQPQ